MQTVHITAKLPKRSRVVRSRKSYSGTIYVTKQKGLSDEVFDTYILQEYMQGVPCGYIGSSRRTAWSDKMLEAALRATGLGPHGIACWLTSTSGRHLADNLGRGAKAQKEFAKDVAEATKNAFLQVTVWNHPDHGGMLKDTISLEEKILNLGKQTA